ncbi:hypothetical protein MMC28_001695 [Mycoblastus sanguinarius]|nr:hypothetical protein [Mycoblastus sanguinarius]
MFSPAFEIVHDDYDTWRFNGTFRFNSPYKGPPSPSVDAAWDEISSGVGVMSISHDTLRKIGASEDSIRLPPESGGGYMGALEVFHQIHCVNLLWQGTNADYYKDKSLAWTDSPATLRQHLGEKTLSSAIEIVVVLTVFIDHCADLLRQKLMCDADVGVITYNWVKNHSNPYPNFNTLHKCRNFDDVLAWGKSHQASKPHTTSGAVERTDDAVEMDLPP